MAQATLLGATIHPFSFNKAPEPMNAGYSRSTVPGIRLVIKMSNPNQRSS